MSTLTRERIEQLANGNNICKVTREERIELARIALASLEAVPSPELLCQFVMQNYANYQGAWLCGKSSEILSFLLLMAGHECEKVACTINGVGHLYVRCGDLILDPSIAQFGDYPEISRGEHPCAAVGYVENSTEPQKYRNAGSDSDIIRAMKIAPASLEAEPVAYTEKCEITNMQATGLYLRGFPDNSQGRDIALYTAPPAPVSVPDDVLNRLEHEANTVTAWHHMDEHSCKVNRRDLLALVNACRADMLQGAEPISQPYTLPTQGSEVVNEAAWTLFNMLTEHGPLNGHQFNNLKDCFYEALKVAMRNAAAPKLEVF